jgi:hypothetical protein
LDVVKNDLVEYRKRFDNSAFCILASLDNLSLQPNSIDMCMLQYSLDHTNGPVDVNARTVILESPQNQAFLREAPLLAKTEPPKKIKT